MSCNENGCINSLKRCSVQSNYSNSYICKEQKFKIMSLPTNNKKAGVQTNNNSKSQGKGSKFIKSASKPAGAAKKVRSTGANRGS